MKLIYLLTLVVMTTVANVVSERIPKCSIWHMMGRIPDETNCTRYYQCIFAIPRLTLCPKISDKQTYFDPTLEMCLWSETSPCNNPSSTPGSTSTSTTPKSSSMTCNKYDPIPDTPTKPADCEGINPCNGPKKGSCTEYYEWNDDKKTDRTCIENTFYNIKSQQCESVACPPCPESNPPF